MRTTEKNRRDKDEVFEEQIGFFDDEDNEIMTAEKYKRQEAEVIKEFLFAPVKQLVDEEQNKKREQLELALVVVRLGNELIGAFNELLKTYEENCKTQEELDETKKTLIPLKDRLLAFAGEKHIKKI